MESPEKKYGLSGRQVLFAQQYFSSGNALQSALAAGYSPKAIKACATRLMGNKNVSKYLADLREKAVSKHNIDRDYIIDEYMQLLESAKEMDPETSSARDRATWAKALTGLSKLLGLDAPVQTEVTVRAEQPLFLDDSSDIEDIDLDDITDLEDE